ncbi:MAG TPA: hypothetical protein VLX28_05980 [Thermoanaerobaculia bacterium]|nr:hypothetical protein [Thermoanaerobaculia bacterium]
MAPSPRPAAVRLEPKVTLAAPAPAVPPRTLAREPRPGAMPAAPAIQVTIGRLEVRAAKAPQAVAAGAASSPKSSAVSLEEYLGRRSRGGNR